MDGAAVPRGDLHKGSSGEVSLSPEAPPSKSPSLLSSLGMCPREGLELLHGSEQVKGHKHNSRGLGRGRGLSSKGMDGAGLQCLTGCLDPRS